MPETFFTSDHHFSHAKILSFQGLDRDFASIAEHDDALVRAWNAVVDPRDKVWHLGDFCLGDADRAAKIFRRLHGDKHLVRGNHDRRAVLQLPWGSVHDYYETKVDGQRINLSHYPMESWNAAFHGSVMLHGHTHGGLAPIRNRADVGVDVWGFRPASWPEVRSRINAWNDDHPFQPRVEEGFTP